MKRLVMLFALLLAFLFSFGASAMPPESRGLHVSLVVPPVIREAVSFPVVAVITNDKVDGGILLQKARWHWGQKDDNNYAEYTEDLAEELEPTGPARRIVNELRSRKGALTPGEISTLKAEYEKLKKGTTYLRFTVTQEMAAEIKARGAVKLAFTLTGRDLAALKASATPEEIVVRQEAVLTAGRELARPQVPPGAHHSGWYFGDTHSHSTYTWDYYFGDGIYTIPELKSLAKAAGLDWLVLTDHAYCLDTTKFNEQKSAVTSLSDSTFAFLYGEELSAAELVDGVKSYDTCHYNGILNSSFVPCETDIFRKASSPDSQQGINYLKQYGGLVTINHPNWGTGAMEAWNFNIDTYPYTHGETGMEILNGGWDDTNNGSTTRWVDRRLLKGEKVFPFAGSDTESTNHFGECSTVVYADYLTQANIKANLGLGRHYVTTYPGLAMWARKSGTSPWSWMGDTLTMGAGTVEVYISYADSYDGMYLYVMKGKAGWSAEQQIYSTTVGAGNGSFTIYANVEPGSYLRVYCQEITDGNYRAYTAPIWFD